MPFKPHKRHHKIKRIQILKRNRSQVSVQIYWISLQGMETEHMDFFKTQEVSLMSSKNWDCGKQYGSSSSTFACILQRIESRDSNKFIYLFILNIYLFSLLGLSCSTQDLFGCSIQILCCGMWDSVPWPGIEPRPPALGVQSLSLWTTRGIMLFTAALFTTAER